MSEQAPGDGEQVDEFTPRERGLLFGNHTAQRITRGQLTVYVDEESPPLAPEELLRALASDPPVVPVHLRDLIMDSGMAERLAESEDPDAESAFWGGFVSGVRAHIVELRIGAGDN